MNQYDLLSRAKELAPELTAHRRHLHACPEIGFDLPQTTAYVKAQLEAMGYTPQPCGKSGLVALAGGKRPGKVFLLRADMDALPIREEAEVDFAAQNGSMHACGHDLHTAMLLGAARLLKEREEEIPGTVKLMFQPAEEIILGAVDMLEDGLLENPKVDAAMMIHAIAATPAPPGTVVVSAPGVSAPAADYFTITVRGRGCHGSSPNTGVDPLTAAAHILIALQELHARELAMGDRAALTIGTFHGGTADNAIPDAAVLGGSMRAFSEETRVFLKGRLTDMATGIAAAFRGSAEVAFGASTPCLDNDEALTTAAHRYAVELLGEDMALSAAALGGLGEGAPKMSGSEDFAYVSQRVPSVMLALAAGQPQQGHRYPQHHPSVTFDEEALPYGAAVYAHLAMRWLEDNG